MRLAPTTMLRMVPLPVPGRIKQAQHHPNRASAAASRSASAAWAA